VVADDFEAAELAAQTTVFAAAGAVLSGGRPVEQATIGLLRAAMVAERIPPDLVASVCEQCAKGVRVEDVPVNPGLDEDQAALFSVAIILFALRATPEGDPLEVASRLCAPYRVTPEFVAAFARELSSTTEARRSTDTAESLRLLLEPPEMLVQALRRYRTGTRPARPPRRSVTHVSPQRIQHADDREASEALREVSGLDDLVGFVMKHALEKMERVNNVGGKVRVGPQQFPGLYEIFRGCVARSGVKPEPELFLENGSINAYTFGTDRPYIVLHTGAITLLSTAELEFILGHELGHIRFKHVLNLTLARILPRFASQLPFGGVISAGLDLALFDWERKAELSADRMGLLVCQDPDAALRVMVKLSGVPAALYRSVNVEAFLAQYEDFQALDKDATGALAKVVRSAYQDHPWTVVRAYELRRWAQGGEYERLLSGGSHALADGSVRQLSQGDLLPFECPVCSSLVSPELTKCGSCGGPCTERNRFRRCGRCGSSCKPSLQFCENCGARQQAATEVAR
jgi:hypothetical protein